VLELLKTNRTALLYNDDDDDDDYNILVCLFITLHLGWTSVGIWWFPHLFTFVSVSCWLAQYLWVIFASVNHVGQKCTKLFLY